MKPTIGRIVIFRSRTGDYDVPAMVTATKETLNPRNVEAGHIPGVSSETNVHLTVFTPGPPGKRADAADFKTESEHGRSENVAGTYQEWDVPQETQEGIAPASAMPGSWRWPDRVAA